MMAAEQHKVRGEVRLNEPMSKHTSWRVGGLRRRFSFRPVCKTCRSSCTSCIPPFRCSGRCCSNLLVRDGGIPGVVISAARILKDLERVEPYAVRAGSGLAVYATRAAVHSLENWSVRVLCGYPGDRWRGAGHERRCSRR